MLQSCFLIAVINIDVGFVAGAYAAELHILITAAERLDTGEKIEFEEE